MENNENKIFGKIFDSVELISEEHLEEIRSQYVADCRAEAGISADNEDYEDYDCDDIDVNRYQEDEGYFNIVNNIVCFSV